MFTPTFFVNGYQLPEVYKVGDLKNLIPSIQINNKIIYNPLNQKEMKNLRLKALAFGAAEVLTRAQIKKVRGGGGTSNCIKNEYYGCEGSDRKCCPGCTCKTVTTPEGSDSQCQGTCPYT